MKTLAFSVRNFANKLWIRAVLLLVVCPTIAAAQVQINIDAAQSVKAISPFIYGANSTSITNATLQRLGGNRWTAYNWENNASNAGNDYIFQNDNYLVRNETAQNQNIPGQAVLPTLQAAKPKNQAVLLTIPINGYVSADKLGNGDVRIPMAILANHNFRKARFGKRDSSRKVLPSPADPPASRSRPTRAMAPSIKMSSSTGSIKKPQASKCSTTSITSPISGAVPTQSV